MPGWILYFSGPNKGPPTPQAGGLMASGRGSHLTKRNLVLTDQGSVALAGFFQKKALLSLRLPQITLGGQFHRKIMQRIYKIVKSFSYFRWGSLLCGSQCCAAKARLKCILRQILTKVGRDWYKLSEVSRSWKKLVRI